MWASAPTRAARSIVAASDVEARKYERCSLFLLYRLQRFSKENPQIVRFFVYDGADGHKLAVYTIENHMPLTDRIANICVNVKTGAECRAGLRNLLEACTLGKDTVQNTLGRLWISICIPNQAANRGQIVVVFGAEEML